jgi:hypothetical protein
VQRVIPNGLIEDFALARKRIPPEDMAVHAAWSDEDRGGKVSLGELLHALVYGAGVSIIERDRDAGAPVTRLVDLIERRDIGLGSEHVELHGEISLGNE